MPLSLTRLNVSLTKHGAHKIALLLRKYDKDLVLKKLWGQEPGINIDFPQACKTLSVGQNNKVPDFWAKAKDLGPGAIDALVLVAIIFSHHQLISVMSQSQTGPFRGVVHRAQLGDKAYTNFAHTIDELGFATFHSSERVEYDLRALFQIAGLNELAMDLIGLKLRTAGWDGRGTVLEQLLQNQLNRALAITPDELEKWLRRAVRETAVIEKDREFFSGQDELLEEGQFSFRPGHVPKKTGVVARSGGPPASKALLLHNQLQTQLYKTLVLKFGEASVGCEVPTGQGSYIDVVVKTEAFCWFYELKIAGTARACIRQATAQLLEYAYWTGKPDLVQKLIIVGTPEVTAGATRYLAFLRKQFGAPLYYEQIRRA